MAKKIGMGLDRLLSGVQLNRGARGVDGINCGGIGNDSGGSDGGDNSLQLIKQLSLDELQPGRYQPRTYFSDEELRGLADSIGQHGVLQPIVARFLKDENRYEIIAGERRWRAARLAKLTQVPVVVKELSDQQAMALALIENLQRENLTTWELVNALRKLVQDFSLTHDEAAKLIGRSRSSVSNLLRLLDLPVEVQEFLRLQKLEMGHARALLTLSGQPQLQTALAHKIAAQELSVRMTEALVKQYTQVSRDDTILHNLSDVADASHCATQTTLLEEAASNVKAPEDTSSEATPLYCWKSQLSKLSKLSKRLAIPLQVKLNKTHDAGRLIIDFHNQQEFEYLLTRLRALLSAQDE